MPETKQVNSKFTNMRTPLGKDGLQTLLSVYVLQRHIDKWFKLPDIERHRKYTTKNPFALAINEELDKRFHCYIDHVSILICDKGVNIEYTHATPLDVTGLLTYIARQKNLDFIVDKMFSFPIPTKYLKIRSKKSCYQTSSTSETK